MRRASHKGGLLGSAAWNMACLGAAGLLGASGAGCGAVDEAEPFFEAPESLEALSGESFLDHPWPSDLRLENGSPRLTGMYNPRAMPILDTYAQAMTGVLDGFSPQAAGYLRFRTALDPSSLPADPVEALDPEASVQLIDVDPESPERGQRKLVSLLYREEEGVYWQPNTLAFMPTLGSPLRPKTRYALVVTDKVRTRDGGMLQPSAALSEVLGLASPTASTTALRQAYTAGVVELERNGFKRSEIVHLTIYTTADPVGELFAVADDVYKSVPAPAPDPDAWTANITDSSSSYHRYIGMYGPSPNYQAGNLPFAKSGDGGAFQIVNGAPLPVNMFWLRFSITVPKPQNCPMPPGGYPIVLYGHGTGGDYISFVSDKTAQLLGEHCLAVMGIDQIFHGTRPGAPSNPDDAGTDLLFFNVENVIAARTNPRQGAIDEVQRARLFTETQMTIPAGVSKTGEEVRFDPTKVLYFGHSQGGLSGPLFLASSNAARGGVLSGAGAVFGIALLEKDKPEPAVSSLVATIFLGLKGDEKQELSLFHPAISFAQSLVDVCDTAHYARHLATEPRPGFAPKSIYMTEGINPDGTGDSYAPPRGIEAHGLAARLPLQEPEVFPIPELAWEGPPKVIVPPEGLSANIGNGAASGVFAQWPLYPGEDGHFVIFYVEAARQQSAGFLKNLADNPQGRVPAP